MKQYKLYIILIVVLAAFVGVSIIAERNAPPSENEHDHMEDISKDTPQQKTPTPEKKERATLEPGEIALIKTTRGNIKFVIFEKDMPITSKNFIALAKSGFYKRLKFHRVEDWVVQGGDPKGDGTGGSDKKIKLEIKDGLGFEVPYMVGMARTNDPDSGSSQFFVTKVAATQIQASGGYACFGLVYEGSNVIKAIKKGDRIKDVVIANASGKDTQEIEVSLNKLKQAQIDPLHVNVKSGAGKYSHQ
ncbi:MAG: peptidylprolyl isomerase [Armatimonadota bacterium]